MKHYQERLFLEQYPLSSKKPLKKTIASFFPFLLIAFFFSSSFFMTIIRKISNFQQLISDISHGYGLVVLLVGILALAGLIYMYQLWYSRTYFYNATDKLLIIRKGPLAPQEITIPFNRIQDIYLDQDVLDRLFGIYDVHISTATATSGVRAHIDGVEKDVAEKLREFLIQKIHESHIK